MQCTVSQTRTCISNWQTLALAPTWYMHWGGQRRIPTHSLTFQPSLTPTPPLPYFIRTSTHPPHTPTHPQQTPLHTQPQVLSTHKQSPPHTLTHYPHTHIHPSHTHHAPTTVSRRSHSPPPTYTPHTCTTHPPLTPHAQLQLLLVCATLFVRGSASVATFVCSARHAPQGKTTVGVHRL